jgi:hypothetical protein
MQQLVVEQQNDNQIQSRLDFPPSASPDLLRE